MPKLSIDSCSCSCLALTVLLMTCADSRAEPGASADPAGSYLGSHTLVAHENGNGPSVVTTDPIDTAQHGSSLVVFSAGYASNGQAPTDNKANAWIPLGDPVFYRGWENQFDVKAYLVESAIGGSGHTVSIQKDGMPSGEITVPFVEIRDSAGLQSAAWNYPEAGATVSSGSVTTTGPATLVAFWWGDAGGLHHSAEPDNGFTIIERFVDLPPNSAVQCAVAFREVAAAGTYQVTWSHAPIQGAPLWLLAFQSSTEDIFLDGFDPDRR